jgi:Ca2+-binding EF-hand superfamily protein
MRKTVHLLSFLCAIGLVGTPSVKAQDDPMAPLPMPGILILNMSNYREAYIAQLLQPFRQAVGEDQVLTAEDIDRERMRSRAAQRASVLSIFFSADLNGDNRVTAEEWQAPRRYSQLPNGQFGEWDTNNDGVASLDEAFAHANAHADNTWVGRQTSNLDALMALDPNKDGKLTATELEQVGLAAFSVYDRNSDGTLSADEMASLNKDRGKAVQDMQLTQQLSRCNLRKAEAGEKLYLISAYQAGTLSSVTVAGQDQTTETAEINVEDGKEPLYIVASSYKPMIWRLTGHVERVAYFAGSASGGIGVTGLPKEKTNLTGDGQCLQRLADIRGNPQASLRFAGTAFGKQVDGIYNGYSVPRVSLPSDTVPPNAWDPRMRSSNPPTTFSLGDLKSTDDETLASLRRFSPGGLFLLDPATVVASASAQRYEILPAEAGLLQLLQSGSIRNVGHSTYLIQAPIARYPAGLAGAHAVHFILADGVPPPAGNPGHSQIITLGAQQKNPAAPRQ